MQVIYGLFLTTKTPGAPNDGTAPVAGSLIINEFMSSNDTTYIPDGGPDDYPDWIEIYNTGDTPLDIGGWYVTDDMADPIQYQIPTDISDQTIIPGHGYLLLKCDGTGEGLHTNFKLGSGGEDIGLSKMVLRLMIQFHLALVLAAELLFQILKQIYQQEEIPMVVLYGLFLIQTQQYLQHQEHLMEINHY